MQSIRNCVIIKSILYYRNEFAYRLSFKNVELCKRDVVRIKKEDYFNRTLRKEISAEEINLYVKKFFPGAVLLSSKFERFFELSLDNKIVVKKKNQLYGKPLIMLSVRLLFGARRILSAGITILLPFDNRYQRRYKRNVFATASYVLRFAVLRGREVR